MTPQRIGTADLFSIAGKVALVTGGSRGIGRMIAQGYVEAGAKVYISSRKAEACDAAAGALSELGACVALPEDIATEAGCTRLAQEVARRENALHVLVNNAAANWGASIETYPEAAFDKVMSTNVKSIFMLTRALLPLLERAGRRGDPARVINIGSIDGLKVPFVDNFAYAASKAAVHHLTRVLAVKLGARNIAVNTVAPGPFESKMTEWMLETFRDQIERACPLHRIGEPGDMAGVAIYLASRAAAYVSGALLTVDGGLCVT
ncbi:MAG: SDR family oxidoreductase [Candidatus Rokubacteria bacterium]|nr:SDR family oxidoreductase [Candidatus Rokubacteria bacterium]